MCFIKELAPITFACGFIKASVSILDEYVCPWRRSIGLQLTREYAHLPLREAMRKLDPLSSIGDRELWVETQSDWLACFTNSLDGGTGPVAFVAGETKTRAVSVRCAPHTMPARVTKDTRGLWGATILEIYGPERTEFLNYERTIACANDGGPWVFETWGKVQPFEETERYLAPRIRDRFTPEMLESYCRALGIEAFNESFYKASAVLLGHSPTAYKQPPRILSLAEQRQRLGLA